VTLHHFIGGAMTVHYTDRILPMTAYGTYPVPDPAEDEKTFDVRLDAIVTAQLGMQAPSVRTGVGNAHSLRRLLIARSRALPTPFPCANTGHSYLGETGDITTLG
jgi:hypothetical protein